MVPLVGAAVVELDGGGLSVQQDQGAPRTCNDDGQPPDLHAGDGRCAVDLVDAEVLRLTVSVDGLVWRGAVPGGPGRQRLDRTGDGRLLPADRPAEPVPEPSPAPAPGAGTARWAWLVAASGWALALAAATWSRAAAPRALPGRPDPLPPGLHRRAEATGAVVTSLAGPARVVLADAVPAPLEVPPGTVFLPRAAEVGEVLALVDQLEGLGPPLVVVTTREALAEVLVEAGLTVVVAG